MRAQQTLAQANPEWTGSCTPKGNLLATAGNLQKALRQKPATRKGPHAHIASAHPTPESHSQEYEELSMSAMPALAQPALVVARRKPAARAAAPRTGLLEAVPAPALKKTVKQAKKHVDDAALTARRDRIVLENLPLVKAIAVRVHENLPVHVDMDDLVHAGILGLFDAATKFDPEKMVSFSSYAKHRIKGAILDSLRQLDWASRDLRRRHKQMEAATRELASELHRNPSEHEVAARMGVEVDRWRQMMLDLRNVGLISASQRPADQDDLPAPDFPATPELQPDNLCARQQMRSALSIALKVLPERYQKVVLLYYTNELTMKEIGNMLGINESRVSQIHKTALEKMAFALQESGIRSSAAF
jgi:RNA polymerase sigma factor FliA